MHQAKVQAKANGQKTYYTGVPCARGHTAARKVSSNNCLECQRETNRAYRQRTPDFQLRNRLSKYNLSVEQYRALLAQQGGGCGACRTPLDDEIHVDHNHETGEVRGLLCRFCNIGLGHFKDSAALLRAAAEYLERK